MAPNFCKICGPLCIYSLKDYTKSEEVNTSIIAAGSHKQDNVPTCVKECRSQAISCNGCATVTRGQLCETSKLLHVASE